MRAELASITNLSTGLENSARAGGKASVPTVDMGPSTAAVQGCLAEILRAETGVIEVLARTGEDLDANKKTYATTETGNKDLFRPIGR